MTSHAAIEPSHETFELVRVSFGEKTIKVCLAANLRFAYVMTYQLGVYAAIVANFFTALWHFAWAVELEVLSTIFSPSMSRTWLGGSTSW